MGLCHSVLTSFYRPSFYLCAWLNLRYQAMHQIWETPQLEDTKVGHCIYLSSVLLSFLNPMHHILCLLISFCKAVPLFLFSSSVLHFPILRSILLPSPSYYHYLHSFFLPCSVSPRWLTVQTRRGKLGCSHNDRPFVLICSIFIIHQSVHPSLKRTQTDTCAQTLIVLEARGNLFWSQA